MDGKALAVFLLIGLVAGWLASVIIGGDGGILRYLISGVLGAFVGPMILQALKVDFKIGNPLVSQIVTSTIGAIVVVVIARVIA